MTARLMIVVGPLGRADGALVRRVEQRLAANGIEANRLRALLLVALADAAHLAGDADEARALHAQLAQLAAEWRNA